MDFETSCWSTGPLTNSGAQTFYNYENPVQRRPKIDYFDTSIQPIVSHISSNGYYGYCPTTNVPCSVTESSDNQRSLTNINDIDKTNEFMPMESIISEHTQHQGRSMFENRKRTVQNVTNDEYAEQDAKRRRSHLSVIDYDEDIQMSYDENKDILIDPSNIASNRFEQFFVYINENTVDMGHNLNTTHQIESKIKHIIHTDTVNDVKKTDEDISTPDKENISNDMETLYWHTHGSLLWQR